MDVEKKKIIKGTGFTPAERYLKHLCEKSFLSLWSYPNVFRKQGKELCDLLVVFGDDIIIFSDKYCVFPETGNIESDWKKWFRRAVADSAQQIWGAERWIKQHPDRIFLDSKCLNKLPLEITIKPQTKFHLVVVAHGASKKCHEILGGSGSMMLKNDLKGINSHTESFTIGDIDPNKTFIHVLDDTTLDVLMSTRDTIADFTEYLRKKELFFRSDTEIFSTGEEELLSAYLRDLNSNNEHDFVLPNTGESDAPVNAIFYPEGSWDSYMVSEQRGAQIKENEVSYIWDNFIETCNKHALGGTQYYTPPGGITDTEKTLRFMAKETRFRRRVLAQNLMDILKNTDKDLQRIRVITPTSDYEKNPHYVFLLFPRMKERGTSDADYRRMRQVMLESVCLVTRLKDPEAKHIIGIATESGMDNNGRSEDVMYQDGSYWTEELEAEAKRAQAELKILLNPTTTAIHSTEYPETVVPMKLPDNPRNKPCPCGSNLKYKKCHGK